MISRIEPAAATSRYPSLYLAGIRPAAIRTRVLGAFMTAAHGRNLPDMRRSLNPLDPSKMVFEE